MAISYPRVFPNFDFTASRFGLSVLQSSFEAEASRQPMFQNFNGGLADRWEGMWTVQRVQGQNLGALRAWMTSLNGRSKTFYAYDPDQRNPNGNILGGSTLTCDSTLITCDSTTVTADDGGATITINGASQTGKLIAVSSEASKTGLLLAGDYVQIGLGLHMLTNDLDTDASGDGWLEFEPVVRVSPANGDVVIYSNPVMVARLSEAFNGWDSDINKMSSFTFAFEEAL